MVSNTAVLIPNFIASSFVGALAVFLGFRPSGYEVAGSLAGGALLAAGFGLKGSGWQWVMIALAYWGMGAIITRLVLLYKGGREDLLMLAETAFAPIMVFASALFVGPLTTGRTYDYFFYSFDGTLGFQPGFWAAGEIMKHDWIAAISGCAYVNLPLAVALLYIYFRRTGSPQAGRLVAFCVLIGLAGYFCYQVLPAVGAMYAFPDAFPFHPPPPSAIQLVPLAVGTEAIRNCMPSLHTSWGLALLWFSRGSSRVLRICVLAYLVCMLFHTLGLHYFVDMVVAFPFSLALYAAAQPPSAWKRIAVWGSFLVGGALMAAWLLLLRFAVPLCIAMPAISYACIAATIVACQWLRLRLDRSVEVEIGVRHLFSEMARPI